MIDKDLNKLFRKFFQGRDIPIRGIMKKRGTNFAFLQFEDQEQRKEFQEVFNNEIAPSNKKYRLKEAFKSFDPKVFTPIKSTEEMKQESQEKKDKTAPTKEEIEEEMKITVEERVTPYYNLPYKDQLEKKKE